jgi:ribosome-associated protein
MRCNATWIGLPKSWFKVNEQPSSPETIRLDQFLKLAQVVQTGGEAKQIIQAGEVLVNGQVETRRGRKLCPGDVVIVQGEELVVMSDADDP